MAKWFQTNNHGNQQAYSRHKLRTIRNIQAILNKVSVCRIYAPAENGKICQLFFSKGERINPTESLVWSLNNIRVKWDILAGVICRDQSGEHYLVSYAFQAKKECLWADIENLAENACKHIFNECPIMHRLCPFWLAVPNSSEHIDAAERINLLIKTIHGFGVLNRIRSEFESNVNKPYVDYHTGKEWFDIALSMKFKESEMDIEALHQNLPDFEHLFVLES